MTILSIQSHVAYGHVGNSAAVFPLQRLGVEVWPIHTVQFSNHTGYGAFRGEVFAPSLIDACVDGLAEREALARCDAVLSGYVGAPETGDAILRAAERVKRANPAALWCCDPVIGDEVVGAFVRPGVAEFFRDGALPRADIVTPNHFELECLAGRTARDLLSLKAALAILHRAGPRIVLITSLALDNTPTDAIDMAVSDGEALWRVRTPRRPCTAHGAGDATAALFLAHQLKTRAPERALAAAGSSVWGLLARTHEAGSRELLIVQAQEEFVRPSRAFTPERIA